MVSFDLGEDNEKVMYWAPMSEGVYACTYVCM